jgi:hypothetical protein
MPLKVDTKIDSNRGIFLATESNTTPHQMGRHKHHDPLEPRLASGKKRGAVFNLDTPQSG